METKSIRISEKVHTKLKIHVAKNKKSIVEFADKAILDALDVAKRWKELSPLDYQKFKESAKHHEGFKKIMNPKNK